MVICVTLGVNLAQDSNKLWEGVSTVSFWACEFHANDTNDLPPSRRRLYSE